MNKIDKYLNMIGYELQIPDEKFNQLEQDYNALAKYISNNHNLADDEDCSIYYQGSFAIDTAILPLRGDEFDVDMVVEFDMRKDDIGPVDFYNQLFDTFKNGRYSEIVEKYKNNIRINYKNNYHVDIMPSIPTATNSKKLYAPNIKTQRWNVRSPKRYRDWFMDRAKLVQGYNVFIKDHRALMESVTTPLKEPQPYEQKPILNRVVQLLKRSRNVYFDDNDDCVPQSIVITTLAAKYYKGEMSVYDALYNITTAMKSLVDSGREYDVFNPASDGDENFVEKWHKENKYYVNFKKYVYYLYENVKHLSSDSLFKSAMNNLFNNNLVDKVKTKTIYDPIWENKANNIVSENVFPDKKITIEKKERGNA